MKKLKELDISPTPWILDEKEGVASDKGYWLTVKDISKADACLIAAAPKLYDALHTAMLYADKLSDGWPLQKHVKEKMRTALAEAAGESGVRHE